MRISRTATWFIGAVMAAGVITCGGDLVNPRPGSTRVSAVKGVDQTGLVGAALPESLVVLVTDGAGEPQSGVTVEWEARGGGRTSAATTTTGPDGRAGVQRILGTTAGEQGTDAVVADATGSPVSFRHVALAPGEAVVTVTRQPPSSALDGEVFAPDAQPVVTVRDVSGAPLVGVQVVASIASGGGTLEGGASAPTDASGAATFADLGIRGAPGPRTLRFEVAGASATSSGVTISALPPEATSGRWSPPVAWPDVVPVHAHLLPNGRILGWGRAGQPQVYDPAANSFTEAGLAKLIFCAGHAFLSDGRLLVAGGHFQDAQGIKATHIFDPNGGSWTARDTMARGRWYPTVTTLPDGRAVVLAGTDTTGQVVDVPELFDPATGRYTRLTGAPLALPWYPRTFIAPDGRVFYAGERSQSRWLDVNATGAGGGRGSWTAGPTHQFRFQRDYGTAVMYAPGKILYVGGGGDPNPPRPAEAASSAPTETAEVIDLDAGSPAWRFTAPMSVGRRHLNGTLLPDGQVLITGGTRGAGFSDISDANATRHAELWDPTTEQWTTLAANAITRVYHAVSLLLPDGRVMHGASGDALVEGVAMPRQTNHEIFSPPYLFKGTRPTITSAPASVGPAQTFQVQTPFAAQVARVTWIRLGSVTHAFDENQRMNDLAFTLTAGAVTVTAPENRNLAPPGHYLLFVLNRNGVPSEGRMVQFQ